MPTIGIYKITSPSGNVYIGQSFNIENRLKYYTAGRCYSQKVINDSIKKYGYKAHKFEIIHELPSDIDQVTFNAYELLYWELHKSCGIIMMNIREPGGSHGKLSEECKRKISAAHIGKIVSIESRNRMSASHKGIKLPLHSEESKKLQSLSMIGKGKGIKRGERVNYSNIMRIKMRDRMMNLKMQLEKEELIME